MSFIQLENVNIKLGEFHLKDCSLSVEEGDYFTIIGPTGSGKTILLETIAGFYKPDSGRIIMNGIDITELPPEKRNISIVYQDCMLFPNMNVFDNIAYGLRKKIKDKETIKNEVIHIAKILDIEHLLDRYPTTLSGGEIQRTAIARALIVKPKLLLMDEPFSALDVKTKEKLRNLLKKVIDEYNTTVIHVTHDLDDVWSLANKVAVMRYGKILQIGTPEEIFNKPLPNFVADFVGTNVLTAEVIGKEGNLTVLNVNGLTIYSTDKLDLNDKLIKISIRPEKIIILNGHNNPNKKNIFTGKVKQVIKKGYFICLVVDINGININITITPNTHLLDFKEGDEIDILIKPEDVHIIKY
ncbi:ABC transporter ATPase [Methanocaldococcus villosus KIN24-T80]|uniref:Molybdate/tungstate import ATP-binding protein WtpC n=1 Tax=Methanocaldococcus villosus KIN24-T80 TaxID=1069083 RepID=N6W036_9EURY|nr:ATP-binding cassette domain-containing protein [Methanocaldococcus villosus]ENN96717.1 ABC transporter ATPase [Methanocaldococcus villosus KIN24-T80]